MNKIDGKGHHPKVRPYCRRCDKDLKEVRISVCSSLSAWQLAMRRLGICFTASEKNGIGTPSFAGLSLCEAMEQASSATQSVGVGCTDAGGWYVDTSGCGMLQYDDANPPPKNEFTHSVLKVLAILLSLVLVVVASSCNKTPEPTPKPEPTPTDTIPPVTPNDTITPVTPNDTIVPTPGIDTIPPAPGGDTIPYYIGGKKSFIIDLSHSFGDGAFPPLDSVQSWVLLYDTVELPVTAPDLSWHPPAYHEARDSLIPRFAVSPKVIGGWGWRPTDIVPDELLNAGPMVTGMIRSDSTWFVNHGYGVYPQNAKSGNQEKAQIGVGNGHGTYPQNKVAAYYNGNRVQRSGRSR